MKKDDLARLHWLRKQREEKALKAVLERRGALARAETAAAEAALASSDHAGAARGRELEALGAVVGKELRRNDLLNLQSNLDAAVDRQRTLKAEEAEAAQKRDAAQSKLEDARGIFQRHRRDAEKLEQIVRQRSLKLARRRLVFSEAGDDELHGLSHPHGDASPAAPRSEDA
jgi:hypothetical protein